MKTTIITVFLSSLAAFGAATWVYLPDDPPSHVKAGLNFDPDLPAEERLALLEGAVTQEQYARQLLQEEMMVLTAELESLRDPAPLPVEDLPGVSEEAEADGNSITRRERFARRNSPERRMERLVDAGIDVGLANWIMQREEELQMESLQARFEADRSGDTAEFFRQRSSAGDVLREELGDTDYERYLQANGRSTSISVSSVIGTSPAQTAGLRPGDEITRYDGQRVFNMSDINSAALAGEPGQNVIIDLARDGQPMQVVIPRGPMGITGGRRRR